MYKLLLLSLVAPALSMGMGDEDCFEGGPRGGHQASPNSHRTLYKGEQQFSIEMLKTVDEMIPLENIFFSPFSVYNALLLTYFTARNQTEASLKKALFIPDDISKTTTMEAYAVEKHLKRRRQRESASDYELLNANRLFVSTKETVRECMQTLFKDEIAMTDFVGNLNGSLNMINTWVADQTKNNIKDLLKAGQISTATQLVLANAAYFKGQWKNKFSPEMNKKELFYVPNQPKPILVTMMRQKSTFNHLVSEKLGVHVLEIPYKGDNVSLVIFLPPYFSPKGITMTLERLRKVDIHKLVSEDLIPRPVDVGIPKFNIEAELELVPILEKLNVGDVFTNTADLSGLTNSKVSLDSAIHKAKISIDEEGTTAAAATAIFNFRSSRPLEPERFLCNHPFIYMIYDKSSQNVLFTGIFNKPPPST